MGTIVAVYDDGTLDVKVADAATEHEFGVSVDLVRVFQKVIFPHG
jgi:hypothetical protein